MKNRACTWFIILGALLMLACCWKDAARGQVLEQVVKPYLITTSSSAILTLQSPAVNRVAVVDRHLWPVLTIEGFGLPLPTTAPDNTATFYADRRLTDPRQAKAELWTADGRHYRAVWQEVRP
jgi:hypothetical protein